MSSYARTLMGILETQTIINININININDPVLFEAETFLKQAHLNKIKRR